MATDILFVSDTAGIIVSESSKDLLDNQESLEETLSETAVICVDTLEEVLIGFPVDTSARLAE